MSILQPLALGLLLVLPLIILLHMLRVRRQQINIPSLYFWRQAVREIREQPKLRRPPLTLLLILQLLIAGLVALGLSRPSLLGALGGGDYQASHTIAVLDASASMQATDVAPNRFSEARSQIDGLLTTLDPAASVTLIRMGVTPRILYSGDDIGQARIDLGKAELGGGSANVREALRLANSLVKPGIRNRIVVYTDQAYAPDQQDLRSLGSIQANVDFVTIGSPIGNRAVTLLAARAVPGSTNRFQIFARVANFSNDSVTTIVRALADGIVLEPRELRLAGQTQRDVRWDLPPGTSRVEVRVNGDDQLSADDSAQVILPILSNRRLVLVSAQPDILRRALAAVPGSDVQVVAPRAYAPDPGAALTVFDSFLPPQLPPGGVLIINPPAGHPAIPVEGPSSNTKIARIQPNSRLLDAVDLSSITINQAVTVPLPAWATEVIGADVGPLLFEGTYQSSSIAVFTFKLTDSNLPSRVGFPIMITNLVNHLAPEGLPPVAEPGQPIVIRTGPQIANVTIQRPSGVASRFPGGSVFVYADTEEWGRYQVSEAPASGAAARERYFSVNAGSDTESDLRTPREPRLTAAPPGQVTAGPTRGREIWPWLAMVAIGLLLVEWWVAHR